MKARYLILSLLAATALPMPSADAAVLLIFGQTSTGDTVSAIRTGSSTTITSNTQVDITEIDGGREPDLRHPALNAPRGAASAVGLDIVERFAGWFSITNGATNYLSGTFSDAVFGSGSGLTLTASNPSPLQSVTFTSNVIAPDLLAAFDRAASLSFTDISSAAAIFSGTLRSFNADVSGDFSSTVPEPSTWAMMLLGFCRARLCRLPKTKSRARSHVRLGH